MSAQQRLVALARQIAIYQNYTDLVDGLQPLERLRAKYQNETNELKEALARKTWLHALHEVADVLYYSACIDVQTGGDFYETALRECEQVLRFHGVNVTSEQLEAAALAKYEYRASAPNTKNEAHELVLIQKAVSA